MTLGHLEAFEVGEVVKPPERALVLPRSHRRDRGVEGVKREVVLLQPQHHPDVRLDDAPVAGDCHALSRALLDDLLDRPGDALSEVCAALTAWQVVPRRLRLEARLDRVVVGRLAVRVRIDAARAVGLVDLLQVVDDVDLQPRAPRDRRCRVVRALQRAGVDRVHAVRGQPLADALGLLLAGPGQCRVERPEAALDARLVALRLSVPDQVEPDGVLLAQEQHVLEVVRHRVDGRGDGAGIAVGVGDSAVGHPWAFLRRAHTTRALFFVLMGTSWASRNTAAYGFGRAFAYSNRYSDLKSS